MKSATLLLISVLSVLALSSQAAFAANPVLVVGNNAAVCPTAQYTTIQAAVIAAAPGDTIRVCPGTYPEQITVDKQLTIRGEDGAIVMPGPLMSNATDLITGEAIAAVILVQNAKGVTIEGLIVDGSSNGLSECSPVLMGIVYQNASGTVTHNAVRYFTTPAVAGCQSGNAIWIQSSGGASKVDVVANAVHDYQKNGITGNEAGTNLTVSQNVVTEPAAAPVAAPNGIQLGYGATGSVSANSVSGNVFAPCVSATDCSAASTGILLYESDKITVENNSVGTNQFGIYVYGNNSSVDNNAVFNSLIFDGIVLMGNKNQATGNTVTHSDADAIAIQGNHNDVETNVITDAAVGILKVSGSSGTVLTGNTYHAVLTKVMDPAPPKTGAPRPTR